MVINALVDPTILVFTPSVAAQYAPKLATAVAKGDKAVAAHLERFSSW